MYKYLVINTNEYETRAAFIEDGKIVELFIERKGDSDITGNIYKGRVQRVLPGMQSAFIDIGLEQSAFIYVDDVIRPDYKEFERKFIECDEEDDNNIDITDIKPAAINQGFHIEDMIKEGQEIMVQVAKASMGTKGARVTCDISLPARFLVFMPMSENIGISRRIEDESERNRLKKLILSVQASMSVQVSDSMLVQVSDLNQLGGYIVRTAAEGVQEDKLLYETDFLKNLWDIIQTRYKKSSAPALLHEELNITLKAVRDILLREADKLVIDSRHGYEEILLFLDTFMPSMKDSVELYEGDQPIFDAYDLEGDISRGLRRKIWLKSGGYIIIEHTEALTAIDVNTGRYVGKHNLEETILKTNLEAVKEIAYQIRLRDIGGIIILDFIDMKKRANQDKIFNALKDALKKDRSKTHILPVSEMGLIQMTRKRIKKSLTRTLCESCLCCNGQGYHLSRQTICYHIYRDILNEAKDLMGTKMTLTVNPEIAGLLNGEENYLITSLEKIIKREIIISSDPEFKMDKFEIFEIL